MAKSLELTALRFGRLLVSARDVNTKQGKSMWACVCDCGGRLTVSGGSLISGNTKSCGCLRKEITKATFLTHGMTKTNIYSRWKSMLDRCLRLKNKHYKNYGGRGIAVCDRWLVFENFYVDMGEPPKGLTLERKNNDLGYYKENCIWASQKTQMANTRSNRNITHSGRTQQITKWARELGISTSILTKRLKRGWSVENALFTQPLRRKDRLRDGSGKMITHHLTKIPAPK